ncbi:hypothetical protein EC973_003009 [Apophysomyces ossiformis]|uniref:Uncharacterized protein n=1 Tax=Apophysomyces ossiformis TaxID=679940 RepID=A0A8H7ERT0_9FUNG|nr:hypothetical protein EC973_003009 [Apophysomyces ossiformis]
MGSFWPKGGVDIIDRSIHTVPEFSRGENTRTGLYNYYLPNHGTDRRIWSITAPVLSRLKEEDYIGLPADDDSDDEYDSSGQEVGEMSEEMYGISGYVEDMIRYQ